MLNNILEEMDEFPLAKMFITKITKFPHSHMLGSKELGANVLEHHFVMLTNHDQNVLVLF